MVSNSRLATEASQLVYNDRLQGEWQLRCTTWVTVMENCVQLNDATLTYKDMSLQWESFCRNNDYVI